MMFHESPKKKREIDRIPRKHFNPHELMNVRVGCSAIDSVNLFRAQYAIPRVEALPDLVDSLTFRIEGEAKHVQ